MKFLLMQVSRNTCNYFYFYFNNVYEKIKIIKLKKYIRWVRQTRKKSKRKRILKEKLRKAREKNTSRACESWATIVHH